MVITIQDTGVDISNDIMTKIFISRVTTKLEGQGFGLIICKRLVEAQEYTMSVDSEVGKDTPVTIEIPLTE